MMKFDRSLLTIKVVLSPVAVLFLLVALGGCGFKTLPVAPQTVVPVPITDLRYELSEKGVTLFWSYPIETVSGKDISTINNFILYRAVVPMDSYCETCPIPFGSPIDLPGGSLQSEGKKVATYEATLLRPGNLYFFKVRSKTGWLAESADSNLVSFVWEIPAMAPQGLTATITGSRVELAWHPVTAHVDGTPITETLEYQVSRSVGGASFVNIGKPVKETGFVDTSARTGHKYLYKVQAMSVYDKGMVGGGVSEAVVATPVDKTAPAPPLHVQAIRTGAGIKIIWDRVAEADLKGYRVYRRVSGGARSLIGEVEGALTSYEDRHLPVGTSRLFYSVSSIDRSEPANESVRSPEAMVLR